MKTVHSVVFFDSSKGETLPKEKPEDGIYYYYDTHTEQLYEFIPQWQASPYIERMKLIGE